MKYRVMIIDDEFLIRYTLAEGLRDRGFETELAASTEEGMGKMNAFRPDIVLLDNLLEHSRGMEDMCRIKQTYESVQIILMTAYGSVEQAVTAIKQGAYDYILKPFDLDEIELTIQRCLESVKSRETVNFLKGQTDQFLGRSKAAQGIRNEIQLLSQNADVNVLIHGETGTGKEVVARLIHEGSRRNANLMVRINCGAIPENLLESELFGHEKGAFTGALSAKKGLLELADGGTVFLDEIGELPLSMQAKLLTFLDDMCFKRIGGIRDISVNVRVIAATNRNLQEEIRLGRFREDLYYRLNVFQIEIPPLRQRREDIGDMIHYYLGYYNRKFSRSVTEIESGFQNELMNYDWKGNVRELKNVLERCFLLSGGCCLQRHVTLQTAETGMPVQAVQDLDYPLKKLQDGPIRLRDEVMQLEQRYMKEALRLSGGNLSKAAGLLGISRFAFMRKLEQGETQGSGTEAFL